MTDLTPAQQVLRNGFYGYVKRQRCAACGHHGTEGDPVEACHLRSMVSPKTGDLLPRSHKGLASWGCLPLCKSCHGEQTGSHEGRWIEEHVGPERAFQLMATYIVRYFLEEVHAA